MSVLLWMALGALISDVLILAAIVLSPRLRLEIAMRLFSSLKHGDQDEESLDDLL